MCFVFMEGQKPETHVLSGMQNKKQQVQELCLQYITTGSSKQAMKNAQYTYSLHIPHVTISLVHLYHYTGKWLHQVEETEKERVVEKDRGCQQHGGREGDRG